ncbi:lasso peptide biosynthesis B2 protein [Bacillus sp. PS06]|uniref:lasso peptide biosynthesis B2 protein n=1 Tax=Bacillus sp. PS06 TaxID=2764176 RepID=UPI001784CC97|nr:lasso peptide biosynthesis B2 protein [Bacillus sp. PS06]MBD8071109.1 lasso peptide biosynthesis B2 protein [Bacillus sp. PS06]
MLNRIIVIFRLDVKTVFLLTESFIFLGWARFQLVFRQFSKIAPSLGHYMKETEEVSPEEHKEALKKIRHTIHIMSKYTPWDSKCLVRAMAAMKMLERRGIESTLYLGTGKDRSGKMIAHAWLRSGPIYITGYEEMHLFTVTGKFAKTN